MRVCRKIVRHLIFWSLLFVLVQPILAADLKLKFSGIHPEIAIQSRGYKFFMQKVTEKTNGRITFETYWGARLISPAENIDGTGSGLADLSSGIWISDPGRVPLGCFEYNFLFNPKDYKLQSKIKRQIYDEVPAMNGELAKFNLGPAPCFWGISSYHIMSKKPVKSLADLKGMRLSFTPVEFVPAFKAVGAVPVISVAHEFYDRLERGVVDGIVLADEVSFVFKQHEVAKHHTTINLAAAAPFTVYINMDTWKKLSPEDQKAFREAGKESDIFYNNELDNYLAMVHKTFKSAGVQYYEMPSEDIKKWVSSMPDLPAEWAKKMETKGLPGWKIVERYLDLTKKEGFEFPRKWGVR